MSNAQMKRQGWVFDIDVSRARRAELKAAADRFRVGQTATVDGCQVTLLERTSESSWSCRFPSGGWLHVQGILLAPT